ncbi:MAG: transglutaminase domain-containing protein [Ignavibacteriae bacterium]|nr:transglutaminase domain-containing protein [Ignavibacteriota bacterium]
MKYSFDDSPYHNFIVSTATSMKIFLTILTFLVLSLEITGSSRTLEPSRNLEFSYGFTLKNISKDAKRISIWMPIPQSDNLQTINNLKVDCPYPYVIEKESEYGNLILKIDLRERVANDVSLKLKFQASRSSFMSLDKKSHSVSLTQEERKRFLSSDRLVPIDGKIAEEAENVVGKSNNDVDKARAIYDYITSTMKYDKSGTGWGRGDAIYACDVKRGNCTDFHSLFIGFARASGIPARFVIGFPLPENKVNGEILGYHCWAEFFADGYGWIPVDASEAVKNPEKKEFFFGGLDENRIQFSIGRDIRLDKSPDVEPVNYFIYPFVLVDGKPFENIERHITFSETQKK